MTKKIEIAVFGGGCFWCTEAAFQRLKGVVSVMPGYAGGFDPFDKLRASKFTAGGQTINPTYEEICLGETGHAEVVKIEYDPAVISYADLLAVFFAIHDPTTPNRQGNDVGPQYRSIILYTNERQKNEANRFIEDLNKSDKDSAPIVTEVKPLERFYEAEEYHREYYNKNPDKAYCQVVINPKLKKLQERFAKLLES